jgi:hypothetical protein
MPSNSSFSSQTPATQANRVPAAYKDPASRKAHSTSNAQDSASLLKSIEQIEALPTFQALAASCPLRLQLSPFFAEIRLLLAGQAPATNPILAKLEKIDDAIQKIDQRISADRPASYAQVVSATLAGEKRPFNHPISNAPKEHPRESKQLLIKISNKEDIANLKNIPTEQIIQRIQEDASTAHASRNIIAARKLPSGDIIIHTNSMQAKSILQTDTDWTSRLCPSATIQKKSFAVVIHGVNTAIFKQEASSSPARLLERQNKTLHPDMKIVHYSWLKKDAEQKQFSSLIVEVDCARTANRMILEGVLLQYELKTVELYDPRSRITQCFNCQKYDGHKSRTCRSSTRCGNCGGEHPTKECACKSPTARRRCAACQGGDHPSWAASCPARIKEISRARHAYATRASLHPVARPSSSS